MAKKNSLNGSVAVYHMAIREYTGTLNGETPTSYDLNYKRARSSKFDRRIFLKKDLISTYQIGDTFSVSLWEESPKKYEGEITQHADHIEVLTAKGETLKFNTSHFLRMSIDVAEPEEWKEAAPKAAKKVKKK